MNYRKLRSELKWALDEASCNQGGTDPESMVENRKRIEDLRGALRLILDYAERKGLATKPKSTVRR